MKWGFERINHTLRLCGNPERRLGYVHIAGTNGKGSTARMIQAILTSAGYKTGLYTSPVITEYRDIITIDGKAVTEKEFADIAEYLIKLQNKEDTDQLSEFEFSTVLALLYFAKKNADICVIECGLGGKDDATNIIPPPLTTVLTPISLDHADILGKTLAEITLNKCGIIKPPCSVVTSPDQNDEALAVILETAANNGLTVRIPSKTAAKITKLDLGSTQFEYDDMLITLPLTGEFQRSNALTAIEAVRSLEKHGFIATNQQIIKGLSSAAIPCRQEVLQRSPLIMIDGAHNPQGVEALANTLQLNGVKNLTLITGMLADKEACKCMSLLTQFCNRVICCTPQNPRALPSSKLAEIVRKSASNPVEVLAVDSPVKALEIAKKQLDTPILVAGSFYVAAAVRPILLKNSNRI